MSHDDPIPVQRFTTSEVPKRLRFDAWRETNRWVADVRLTEADGAAEADAVATTWQLNSLVVTESAFGPQYISRGPEHRRGADGDFVRVRYYESGGSKGIYGETPLECRAGEIHVMDLAQEFRLVTEQCRQFSVFLPHAAVGYDPSRHPAHLVCAPDSVVGRLLLSSMQALAQQLPTMRKADAPAVDRGFSGLVRGLLLPETRDEATIEAFAVARQRSMRAFVEQKLADPTLGVDTLCAAFNASRATVYRDFAELGGVANYVTERRLERAYRDLAFEPAVRGQVRQVAQRWCFESQNHFARLFRRRFGITPSDAASLAGAGQPPG